MRSRWFILCVFVLIGCGQPLQINTPSARATPVVIVPAPARTAGTLPENTQTPVAVTLPIPSPQPSSEQQPIASAVPAPSVTLSPTMPSSVVVVPRTAVPLSNEQRWREQEVNRQVFDGIRLYVARQPVPLQWFDPVTGQSVEIGTLIGEFPAQAQFTLRANGQLALEVPYRINNDFGLTAISEALRDRMRAAGYAESVEGYIILSDLVVPKQ